MNFEIKMNEINLMKKRCAMKSLITFIGVVIVFAAIAAVFYGGYLVAEYLWSLYVELDAVIRLVLLSSMAAILLGCLVIAGAIKTSVQFNNKGHLTEAKIRLYKTLVEIYKPYIISPDQTLRQMNSDALISLSEIDADMQILSAGAVLEAHGKLESALRNRDEQDQVNKLFQRLIRRDLGHSPNNNEIKLSYLLPTARVESAERSSPGVSL
jgi:hypothetical protein